MSDPKDKFDIDWDDYDDYYGDDYPDDLETFDRQDRIREMWPDYDEFHDPDDDVFGWDGDVKPTDTTTILSDYLV